MNRQQKERLGQFQGVTGSDTAVATRCLEAAGWSVEGAVDIYYSSGMHMQANRGSGGRAAGPNRCLKEGGGGGGEQAAHQGGRLRGWELP